MTEIEKILNRDFLIQLVSVESIKSYMCTFRSESRTELKSIVELKIMVIEPTAGKNNLSENIYDLKLAKVTSYKIDLGDTDERILEFDTDEVTLEKLPEEKYMLMFINASTNINITFSELTIDLLSNKICF